MRSFFFLALFILLPMGSFAQTPGAPTSRGKQIQRIGLQTGINFPRQVFTTITDVSYLPELKNPARFTAGFYSESGTYEYFVTQIGVFYSSAGYKGDYGSVHLDYLQVPVILNFRTPIVEPFFLQAGLGPYFGFAFNGVEKGETTIDRDILSLPSDKPGDNKPYSFFDGGLVFRGSVEWVLPSNQILTLGVSYHLGVLKVSNKYLMEEDPETEINIGAKNRILSIHLSYLLDLKK
jgi:hypothetical protein